MNQQAEWSIQDKINVQQNEMNLKMYDILLVIQERNKKFTQALKNIHSRLEKLEQRTAGS